MLLGFHLPARARAGAAAPYTTHAAENPEINAWLVIEPDDTIIMRVAQAEMGQGVLTSMPMLVAEELEVDWSRVRAEYADPARHVQNDGVYRRMQTGGSAAVRKSREFRQLAGAEARERLIKAAAELWLVNLEDCRADYGEIHHDASGLSVNYGAIAAAAANVRVANVKIKSSEDFGLLELPTPRLDVPAKVDGSAVYGIDVRLPGMLYAAVRHAPVPGSEVRSLRFNAVCGMPGVVKAVRLARREAVFGELQARVRARTRHRRCAGAQDGRCRACARSVRDHAGV